MDPEPRYTYSRDGSRIAYSATGDGPPLVLLQAASISHIQLYPMVKGASTYLSRLGAGRRLVRVDFRGYGMSDRSINDHSPAAFTDDLEAVLDDLGLEQFDLVAAGARVGPALGLALRRPSAVGRIVLGDPFTVRPPALDPPAPPGLQSLMETNWDLFLEVTVNRNAGRPIGYVKEVISFVSRCMDQPNSVAEVKARRPADDWANASKIDRPVLVLEFADNIHVIPGLMERFAKEFPQGRFMAIPEGALPPPYGDGRLFLQAVAEFLGPPSSRSRESSEPLTARETQVLRLLAAGRTQPEIARALFISPSTVSHHVVSLYSKIGVHRRADAVRWAIRHKVD